MKAESASALKAVEMDMNVIILPFLMAVAQFVPHAFAAVFNDMDKVRILEKSKSPGDDGFVYGIQDISQFRHGKRPCRLGEDRSQKYSVGSRFHPMMHHHVYYVSVFHRLFICTKIMIPPDMENKEHDYSLSRRLFSVLPTRVPPPGLRILAGVQALSPAGNFHMTDTE